MISEVYVLDSAFMDRIKLITSLFNCALVSYRAYKDL